MSIVLKAATSGVFVGVILWLSSQTRLSYLAGLLVFFPVISLPAFFLMGQSGQVTRMREAILWSVWTIPVWLAFAGTLYFCSFRMKILPSILFSIGAWILGATLLVALKK